MPITLPPPGEGLVMHHVAWETFLEILEELGETRGSRLAYDRGRLEFVTPTPFHEHVGSLLGRFVEILGEELDLDLASIKATTLLREDLFRAGEADECFYLANEPLVRPCDELDLQKDPPPDLAIEIDVTTTCFARLEVWRALGIPEVWRYSKGSLEIFVLRNLARHDGVYEPVRTSLSFPQIPVERFTEFLELRHEHSDTEIARRFRAWIREIV